jgi:superfamily I DNA/RNA helicase
MQFLKPIKLTPEQYRIANLAVIGERLIKGAAGSGKTTVAIYRMINVARVMLEDKKRVGDKSKVLCRLITFNRTLKSYVQALVDIELKKLGPDCGIQVHVTTFDKWARQTINPNEIFYLTEHAGAKGKIRELAQQYKLNDFDLDFIIAEITYILGLLPHDELDGYLDIERTGRGTSPKVPRTIRELFLNVVKDYIAWKKSLNIIDGDDLSVSMGKLPEPELCEVIVVDESQDLTANRMRAIKSFLKPIGSLTIVFDSAQRIYRHGYTWKDVGVNVTGGDKSVTLNRNYRNSSEIALYLNSILANADLGPDGTIPDPTACDPIGIKPSLLIKDYASQVNWALQFIKTHIDLSKETVAFLHIKGWFRDLIPELIKSDIDYVDLTGINEWPDGHEQVALLTMSSSKGLEFDHVFILGLDSDITSCESDVDDDTRNILIRLYAVACSRAKKTLTIGTAPKKQSFLVKLADNLTYQIIK